MALTGTATIGTDDIVTGLSNGQLAFAADAITASFTVTTTPDKVFEVDELVFAAISNANDGGTIGTSMAVGHIASNDTLGPSYSIAVAPSRVQEGNAGTGNSLVYTVTRTEDTAAASITVAFGGSASAGTDYTIIGLTGGQLAFGAGAGATTASFTSITTPDTASENDEVVLATRRSLA